MLIEDIQRESRSPSSGVVEMSTTRRKIVPGREYTRLDASGADGHPAAMGRIRTEQSLAEIPDLLWQGPGASQGYPSGR